MSVEPAPTVVVGVGQAGINVIKQLHSSDGLGWGEKYDKYFDYIAIDSSTNEVTNTPREVTEVVLQEPNKYTEADKEVYPYLTSELEIGSKGAKRQRPIGRYKLDNLDTPSWDSHRSKVRDAIERHARDCNQDPDIRAQQLNVIHIHSLGGGTGSGTFPLFGYMLDDVTDKLEVSLGVATYTAGIGVVPELRQSLDVGVPPGDNRYYANMYAALSDLKKMIEASPDDPLPFYLYSMIAEINEDLKNFDVDNHRPSAQLTSSPYRHYYLIGVDEDQVDGDNKRLGPESHRAKVNNTIVAAIYGLAMYGNQIENWFETAQGNDQFGSFGQTQFRIPIDDVRDYCELDENIEALREEVAPRDGDTEGNLIQRRKKKINNREQLQAILDDPSEILKEYEDSESIRADVSEQIERNIPSGRNVLKTSSEDIQTIIEYLVDTYDDKIIAFAMQRAEERVENQGEGIRESWREVVESKYKELEVANEDGFGHNTATTNEKDGELGRYIDKQIEDLEQAMDEEDEDGGILSRIFGGGGDYQEWIEKYRSHKEELNEYREKRNQLKAIKQEIRSRRADVLQDTIRPRVDRLNREIENLREEIDQKEDELSDLTKDRSRKLENLSDAEYGARTGRLALDKQKIREELDRETLEEDLNSLMDFKREGYLARELRDMIEGRVKRSYAWQSTLMSWREGSSREYEIGDRGNTIRDIWMLHSDENSDLPDINITEAGNHSFKSSGGEEDDVFPTFEDPYTIQLMTYCLDSPFTDLNVYADLEEAAEEGWLDAIVDEWRDYRLAFAYPEWYSPEIQRVFDFDQSQKLPKPPELDISNVKVEKEAGELKNWISSYGLASYLWQGDEWDDYFGFVTHNEFDRIGWKHYLDDEHGLSYDEMRDLAPSGRPTKLWMGDTEFTWDDLLEEIQERILEEYGIKVEFVGEESDT